MEIVVATKNNGKLREIREICRDLPVSLSSLSDHFDPVPDIPETGESFYENARLKAVWVREKLGTWALADDSGLEVDALGGQPGIYSARYAGPDARDDDNVQKLLSALHETPERNRTARFRCVLVLLGPDGEEFHADGTCAGRIGYEPIGTDGFGYDPVFVPEGFEQTFAELSSDRKNRISHRGLALRNLRLVLRERFG